VSEGGPDHEPPGLEEERARRLARFSAWAQVGGLVFLAVVSLGLLPRVLSGAFPGLGEAAQVPVVLLAVAVPILLLVVAAFRLPR
jgi:hypothetical protein